MSHVSILQRWWVGAVWGHEGKGVAAELVLISVDKEGWPVANRERQMLGRKSKYRVE